MLNKNFKNWLNRKGEEKLIKDFQAKVDEIKNLKTHKINTPLEEDFENVYYYTFVHEIKSYTNLIFLK